MLLYSLQYFYVNLTSKLCMETSLRSFQYEYFNTLQYEIRLSALHPGNGYDSFPFANIPAHFNGWFYGLNLPLPIPVEPHAANALCLMIS